MPIIKSAKKRVRVAAKASVRNSKTKRNLKEAIKALHRAVTGGKKTVAKEQSKVQSAIDKAAKKNVLHKNKAARKQSQAARAAKQAAGVTKTTAPKKAAAKKPAAAKAKAAPKKPAAKKAAAKKPAATKTATKKK